MRASLRGRFCLFLLILFKLEAYHLFYHFGIAQSDAFHHVRETAAGGEPGDGIDFVEDEPPIRREEHIYPGEAAAVQRTEDPYGRVPDLPFGFGGNSRRHIDGSVLLGVLFREVKEIAGKLNFVRPAAE